MEEVVTAKKNAAKKMLHDEDIKRNKGRKSEDGKKETITNRVGQNQSIFFFRKKQICEKLLNKNQNILIEQKFFPTNPILLR